MFIQNTGNTSVSFIHDLEQDTITLMPEEAIAVTSEQGLLLTSLFTRTGPTESSPEWVRLVEIPEEEFHAMELVATDFWTVQWNKVKGFFGLI